MKNEKRDEVIKDSAEIEELVKRTGFSQQESWFWKMYGGEVRFSEDEKMAVCEYNIGFFYEMYTRLLERKTKEETLKARREVLEATGKSWRAIFYSCYYWAIKCRDRECEIYNLSYSWFEDLAFQILERMFDCVPNEETDQYSYIGLEESEKLFDWGLLEAIDNGTYQ